MYAADLAAQFAAFVEKEHKRYKYETDFYALAAEMKIVIRSGPFNLAGVGPPPYIMLRAGEYPPRRSFTALHEVGHILLKQSGMESEIIHQAEDAEEAELYIEAFANLAASLLLMPEPLLREAQKQHGEKPEAILHLTQDGRASLGAAIRRHVYSDPYERRAAFVVSGNYISDAASAGIWLPFWRYDRVPEVRAQLRPAIEERSQISTGHPRLTKDGHAI